jgi:hypothetical protein
LSDVRRAEARSAQIGSPDFIAQTFQVSAYSGEPFTPKRTRNLFSKRDCSVAESDEVAEDGPEVSFVFSAELLSALREWLTGTRAGSHWLVVRPSGESERKRPSADAGEEVLLSVASEFIGLHVHDAAFIHITSRDDVGADEFAQPCGSLRVIFIVVVHVSQIPLTNHWSERAPRTSLSSAFMP